MMTYVLIILTYVIGGAASIETAEFNSKLACTYAEAYVSVLALSDTRIRVSTTCMMKGDHAS